MKKEFNKYVSLNILSMLGLSLYILADTIFVANGVGVKGLTALNLILPAYSLMNAIGLMLGMGAATGYAIRKAKNKDNEANVIFTAVIKLAVLLALLFTAAGIFLSQPIALLLGADADTLAYAASYLQVIYTASAFFLLNNILVAFVRNDKAPKLAMAAMLTSSFSNIILDYIFIYPMQMGMTGAALATAMGAVLGICVLISHVVRRQNQFHLKKVKTRIKEIRQIFSLGVSSFINEFSSGIVILLFNITLLRLAGNEGVAAYGIIANLALIATSIFTGIGQGIQPLLSRYYGQGDEVSIAAAYKRALILALLFGLGFFLTGFFGYHPLIRLFDNGESQALYDIAKQGIRIYFAGFILMGINMVSVSYFTSLGKAVQSFVISITRGFAAVLIFILVLPVLLGINGVWLTIPAAETITILLLYFIQLKRLKKTNL